MISDIFSKRLRELRGSRKLTLENLGEQIRMRKGSLSDLENGKRPISLDKLILLADYFDVSLDYLVGRSDDPTRH